MSAPWTIHSCHYCGRVVTCPHIYYLSQIVSVPPSADAVTGRVPVATDDGASMHGHARPASASGHQERKEGQ